LRITILPHNTAAGKYDVHKITNAPVFYMILMVLWRANPLLRALEGGGGGPGNIFEAQMAVSLLIAI
jgi:hypothetical protein